MGTNVSLSFGNVRTLRASTVERLNYGGGMSGDRVRLVFELDDGSDVSISVFGRIGLQVAPLVDVPAALDVAPGERQADVPGGTKVPARPTRPTLPGPVGVAMT
ncbi:MAG: hypothetical protein ACREJC_16840 [Tepidisphaeraceae bacterium]